MSFRLKVDKLLYSLSDLLESKYKDYGDPTIEPVNIFSVANAESITRIQIDHALTKINRSAKLSEDDLADLMIHLTLLCLNQGVESFSQD